MFDGLKKRLVDAARSFIKIERDENPPAQEKEVKEEAIFQPIPVVRPVVKEPVREEPEKEAVVIQKQKEIPEPKRTASVEEKPKAKIVDLSLKTKIKSVFVGSVKLNDADIERFLEMMKNSMMQSYVSYDTTEAFLDNLKMQLKDKQLSSRDIEHEVISLIRNSLFSILSNTAPFDLTQFVQKRMSEGNRPVKILFLGTNGTGKTTTIAKLAHNFKSVGISSVLSASDTFRAAAIEQIEHHANKIGVPVIKSTYGADPASVAFDAIAYAKARGIDVVLIDSAGRQETNKSLVEEMKKMVRISKPDLVIFIGESTAGNAIAEQAKEFDKFMHIDGIILTKLDCDAKGGGALSIAHSIGKPVLFFGTGEGYEALVPYTPEFIVDAILPNA